MKVKAMKYHVKQPNDVKKYLGSLENAILDNPDILIGPDYALTPFVKGWNIDFSENKKISDNLKQISSISPDTLLIPGTMPFVYQDKMKHSAPVFFNGEELYRFDKETDVENGFVAKENNLKYKRGDFTRNNLTYEDKKIAVEICSDHGKQPVDKDTFLELILSYDQKAGFYTRAGNDDFSRYAIVCDGQKPLVEGFFYDPNSINKHTLLSPQKINSKEFLFNI